MNISKKNVERFMSKVVISESGCHEYSGATLHGYGVFWLNGKNEKAHRVAYVIANGAIPDGLQVNHHCDNRKCCNPDHLYAGTVQQNVNDREERHRGRRLLGSDHPNTNLTAEDVFRIRAMSSEGMKQKQIASQFSISDRTVGQIVRRERWNHI